MDRKWIGGPSEWDHYLDLGTGKVVGIDDETRWRLEELTEELYDEQGNQVMTLEELLQKREDIQDEGDRMGQGGDVVDQRREERLGRRRLWGLGHRQGGLPEVWVDRLQRCLQRRDQVGEKTRGVVVALVQGEPAEP